MANPLLSLTSLVLSLGVNALGATYTRTSSLVGQSFIDAFMWQNISDPTHGDVNYVDQWTAEKDGLYSVANDSVVLRADNTTVLTAAGPGRNSFNLKSLSQYTTHVAIFDIVHMPEGCGTWPAICEVRFSSFNNNNNCCYITPPRRAFDYREVGQYWPDEGEVDILEGVNNESPNTSTLHTSANCSMPATRTMTGTSLGTNCDVYETNNGGCGVSIADDKSFGPSFNKNGGGWYAMERSDTYFAIYFWRRNSSTVPCEVLKPGETIDTTFWGEPSAYFPNTDCDFSTHFGAHNIIINLDFCGDWAGNNNVYAASGCPSTCPDFVNANPANFTGAYFEFNALNIYK